MRHNGLAYLFVSSRKKMNELKDKVILEIKKIYDPEIPVNISEAIQKCQKVFQN